MIVINALSFFLKEVNNSNVLFESCKIIFAVLGDRFPSLIARILNSLAIDKSRVTDSIFLSCLTL